MKSGKFNKALALGRGGNGEDDSVDTLLQMPSEFVLGSGLT